MLSKWKIVACVLLSLAAVIAVFLHRRSGFKGFGALAVNTIEAAHKPIIDFQTARLKDLEKDSEANAVEIAKAKTALAKSQAELKSIYIDVGLTADEVIARTTGMKL